MSEYNPELEPSAEERAAMEQAQAAKIIANKKEKAERRSRIGRIARKVRNFILMLMLIAAALFAATVIDAGRRSGGLVNKLVVDYRNCEIKIPGTEQSITGTRSYMYRYSEYLGWRWYNAGDVTETTRLNIEGTQLSIIGGNANEPADKTWVKNIDQGERYSQLLENKQRYTIVLGSEERVSVTVDYKDMCK